MPTMTTEATHEIRRTAGLVSLSGEPFPLESACIKAHADAGVARSVLTQVFRNPYREPLEVLYTLPLPADGAVTAYEIRFGDNVIRGEVETRKAAAESYKKALLEGHTAALLEQDRSDTFNQRLGCIPPGVEIRVTIEVLHRLGFLPADGMDAPRWEYRFPTVVGVRYEGGAGRVPDSERLDVDRVGGTGIPVRISATIEISGGDTARLHPSSPSHPIDTADDGTGIRITLREESRLDRDLVIRWNAAEEAIGVRIATGSGLAGDNGRYALVTVTPPATGAERFDRDLTVLLDASGSMSGTPLESAKAIVTALLQSLDERDQFEILAFSDSVVELAGGPHYATSANVETAIRELGRLRAGGSTEMAHAIDEALSRVRPGGQRQVVLLTDGFIGFEREVVGRVLQKLAPGARLHTVGIGSAPNRSLTRAAARAGRGVEVLAESMESAESAARRLLRATVAPVLTDVEIGGTAVIAVAPQRPADILRNQPLVALLEIQPTGGNLEIRGNMAGATAPWVQRMTIEPASTSRDQTTIPLGALFGREAIEDCETNIAACEGRDARLLSAEIENLGLRHRIASRMTSLVAVSETAMVDPVAPRRRERLPVEIPQGVSAEGVGLAMYGSQILCDSMPMSRSLRIEFADDMALGEDVQYEFPGPESAPRVERGVRPLYAPSAPTPPREPLVIRAVRILRLDGRLLTLEFEVPVDGFRLHTGSAEVEIRRADRKIGRARVIDKESSGEGPYPAGVTVRLTLELEGSGTWGRHVQLIRWTAAIHRPERVRCVNLILRPSDAAWRGDLD